MTAAAWALAAATVSAVLGWFLPRLVGAIPERLPDEPPTYREVGSTPGLPARLAAAAAVVGGVLGWARAGEPDVVAFVVLGVLGTAMAYVDLRRHLLPDRLTVPALLLGALLLGAAAVLPGVDPQASYPRAWAAAGGLLLLYLLMALAYPAGLGLGDVKLAAALGLHLGWLSWAAVVVGTVAAFLVGGLVGIVLLALRKATRRTAVPFGPSMLVGALLAVAWAEPVAAWYLS